MDDDVPEKPRVTQVKEPRTSSAGAPGSAKAWAGGNSWIPGSAVVGPGGGFVPGSMCAGYYGAEAMPSG